jgi:hypothetical protein
VFLHIRLKFSVTINGILKSVQYYKPVIILTGYEENINEF